MREIKKDTILFAVVSKDATKSKLIPAYNALFELNSINASAIIMNIKESDLGFFMTNVKKSQIKAILLESDYKNKIKEYLDNKDNLENDFIDCFDIENSQLIGYNTNIEALESLNQKDYLNEIKNSDYKIIASNAIINIKRWFDINIKIPENFDEIILKFEIEKEDI